jgi:two-component system, chemotaxis family, response regulator Rcp1
MKDPSVRPLILVIEENSDHSQQIVATLNQKIDYSIEVIPTSAQAFDFIAHQGQYVQETRQPDLILLNLNLSQEESRSLLCEMKAHPTLKRVPIILLTTSQQPEEIYTSYQLQGNCYVVKSDDRVELTQTVQRIKDFWLGIVTLAPQS